MMTTLGFVIAMVGLINLPPGSPKPVAVPRSPVADLKDGIRYVFQQRAIGMLILASFAIIMIGFPYQSFLPSVASSVYGVGGFGLGLLSSVGAVGAVAATFYVAGQAGKERAWQIATVSGMAFGLALIGLGAAPSFALGLLAMLFVGAFAASFQSMNNALCMQMTAADYTGRVQSINMMSWSMFGLASLPIGILADQIGIRETLAVLGALCVLAIVAMEAYGRLINISADRAAARAALMAQPRRVPAGGR
jgi:predicted MFS family arabinose efflux permease